MMFIPRIMIIRQLVPEGLQGSITWLRQHDHHETKRLQRRWLWLGLESLGRGACDVVEQNNHSKKSYASIFMINKWSEQRDIDRSADIGEDRDRVPNEPMSEER
jgi:hypothetical protein